MKFKEKNTHAVTIVPRRAGLKMALFSGSLFIILVPLLEDISRVSVVDFSHVDSTVKLLFAGDAMVDRTVRVVAEREGYDFLLEPLIAVFEDHDLVIMNLEGPITVFPSVSVFASEGNPHNTRFTFDPRVAGVLGEFGVIVHLGNNHIWDFGKEGIQQTKQVLSKENVSFFGDSGGHTESVLVKEVGGMRVGFVSYNEFSGESESRAKTSLRLLDSSTDFLVLYAHWGEEYTNIPTSAQVVLARQFVDNGADLIVGSHPHVVQTSDIYNHVPIYYSLGNVIFDQYWEKSVRCGALLSVEIKKGEVKSHELIPVRLERTRQTVLKQCE